MLLVHRSRDESAPIFTWGSFPRANLCAYLLSHFSHARLCVTLWAVARPAPLSMGFSRQEYWSGLLFPPPVDLSNPGMEPESRKSPALPGGFFTTSGTWEAPEQASLYSSLGNSFTSQLFCSPPVLLNQREQA